MRFHVSCLRSSRFLPISCGFSEPLPGCSWTPGARCCSGPEVDLVSCFHRVSTHRKTRVCSASPPGTTTAPQRCVRSSCHICHVLVSEGAQAFLAWSPTSLSSFVRPRVPDASLLLDALDRSGRPSALKGTDYFPGLGWMIHKSTWLGLLKEEPLAMVRLYVKDAFFLMDQHQHLLSCGVQGKEQVEALPIRAHCSGAHQLAAEIPSNADSDADSGGG